MIVSFFWFAKLMAERRTVLAKALLFWAMSHCLQKSSWQYNRFTRKWCSPEAVYNCWQRFSYICKNIYIYIYMYTYMCVRAVCSINTHIYVYIYIYISIWYTPIHLLLPVPSNICITRTHVQIEVLAIWFPPGMSRSKLGLPPLISALSRHGDAHGLRWAR